MEMLFLMSEVPLCGQWASSSLWDSHIIPSRSIAQTPPRNACLLHHNQHDHKVFPHEEILSDKTLDAANRLQLSAQSEREPPFSPGAGRTPRTGSAPPLC